MSRISLLHATRGRPQKAVACMASWLRRAAKPENIDYIVAIDEDDKLTMAAFDALAAMIVFGPPCGSASAWFAASKMATGDLLVQVSDDMEPPDRFDELLLSKIPDLSEPTVVSVSDGFRKDRLMATFICTRAYLALEPFLCSEYQSVYSDGEATLRAYQHAAARRAMLIDARSTITITHRHHWHDKSVPYDETYANQNSQRAYELGRKLFDLRNPGWRESGIVDWI